MLGLSSAALSSGDWARTVQPSNEDELAEAETPADRSNSITAFDEQCAARVEALQITILDYLKDSTKRAGSSTFRAAWLPNLELEETARSRYTISAPTMRDALGFLVDAASLVKHRVEESRELLFKLDNFDELGIDDLEVVSEPSTTHAACVH